MFLDFKFFAEYFPKFKDFHARHPSIGFWVDFLSGLLLVACMIGLGVCIGIRMYLRDYGV